MMHQDSVVWLYIYTSDKLHYTRVGVEPNNDHSIMRELAKFDDNDLNTITHNNNNNNNNYTLEEFFIAK